MWFSSYSYAWCPSEFILLRIAFPLPFVYIFSCLANVDLKTMLFIRKDDKISSAIFQFVIVLLIYDIL